MEHKVYIAGVGRCGTSFLVSLLTHLGCDTGFTKMGCDVIKTQKCKAGLERKYDDKPYIIKNPTLSTMMPTIVKAKVIDMLYIPTRNMEHCAASRIHQGRGNNGGLWPTNKPEEQLQKLQEIFRKLCNDVNTYNIPHVFIEFPRLVDDPLYCYEQLEFLMKKYNISQDKFLEAHKQVANPNDIHFR